MQLELTRKTRLGDYLKELYDKYGSNIMDENFIEIEKIWREKFNGIKDVLKENTRDNILSGIPEIKFIDENVIIGKNILRQIISRVSFSDIITDRNVMPFVLENFGENSNVFTVDNIDGAKLKNIISIVKESEAKYLIGVGGGRVLDFLKYVMMKTNKFCLSFPSSLTTHVYTSPKIHLHSAFAELGDTKTIDGPVPDISVIDLNYFESLFEVNPRLVLAGLGDVMACISGIKDWRLAEENKTTRINRAVLEMTENIVRILWRIDASRPISEWLEDYIFIQTLLCRVSGWAGSAPVSGTEHLFALSAEEGFSQPPLHGELVALGTIIATYLQGEDYWNIKRLTKRLKLPLSLSEIGLSVQQTKEALFNTWKIRKKKERFTVVNKIDMNREYCNKVVEDLLRIGIVER